MSGSSGTDEHLEVEEQLTKIVVDPDGEGDSEALWAKSLGNNLYELRNIPIFSRGLHVMDVVRCDERPNELPVVCELVQASGYRTIGLTFTAEKREREIDVLGELVRTGGKFSPEQFREQFQETSTAVLRELHERGVSWERATEYRYALAIPPDINFDEVVGFLEQQQREGILYYGELE